MKRIICFLLSLTFVFFAKAQTTLPIGVPTQKINGWIENWYTVPDSGTVIPRRDTAWRPRFMGMSVTWPRPGVDTVQWFWNGAKWGKIFSPQATSDSSFFYVDYIPQTTDPSYNEGRLFYDNANKTLSLFDAISGTSLQIGQEQYARARNNTGSQINDGSVVYISGASGQTPTIALALANSTNTTGVLGVSTHDISNNSVGKVTTFGLVNNINTSSFLAGDKLYLSPTTPGGITNVEPDVPNFSVFIGYCLNSHITQGKIFVSPIQRVVQIHQINDTSFVSIVGTVIDTIRISSAAAGTVTSVGLSMPSPFTVTNSPITGSGTIGVSMNGTSLQYLRGNGTLATFDTTAIPNFYIKVKSLITPPGSNTQIIYNNSGAFGASADFIWNNTGKLLSVIGALGAGSSFVNIDGDGSVNISTIDDAAAPSLAITNDASNQVELSMGGTSTSNPFAQITTSATDFWIQSARRVGLTGDSVMVEAVAKATVDSVFGVGVYSTSFGANTIYKVPVSGLAVPLETVLAAGPNITTNHTTAIGSNKWQINGGDASDYLFGVSNSTALGAGIKADATTGNAVDADATGGHAVDAAATSGIAVSASASSGNAIFASTTGGGTTISATSVDAQAFSLNQINTSSTADVTVVGAYQKTAFIVTPAVGYGVGVDWYMSSATNSSRQAGREAFKWTTATDATRSSMFELSTVLSGSLTRKLAVGSTGQLILDSYGASTFQVIDTSYNALVIDGSGNVYKRPGDKEPAITATNGLTRVGNSMHLGGTLIEETIIDLDENQLTFFNEGGVGGTVYFDINGGFFLVESDNKVSLEGADSVILTTSNIGEQGTPKGEIRILPDSIQFLPQLGILNIDTLLRVSTTSNKMYTMWDTLTRRLVAVPASLVGIASLNGLTANTQIFATGTSGSDFNIASSVSTHTVNIPSASTSARGLVTTTSQTFGGAKTFNDGIVVTSTTGTPRVLINGNYSSASAPGVAGVGFQIATFTYTSSAGAGTESSGQNFNLIGQPTLTSTNAVTYTGDVSTIRFTGAPLAGGSSTIDHPWNIFANDVNYFSTVAYGINEQSADQTIGLGSHQIYTGSGGNTWTLPSLTAHAGKIYFIKNAGGGNLTVQRGGSDNIYTTSSVTSFTIAAGAANMIIAGSSFWYVE